MTAVAGSAQSQPAPSRPTAAALASNHALIITVSQYPRSPLPGVLKDRELAIALAQRFGVPKQNIVELSEQHVTREGLRQALASLSQVMMPGDKLYVYFSGHGARFLSKASGQCTESLVMQDMHVVTNAEFADMIKPLSSKADKTVVMLDSCHSGGLAQAATARDLATGSPMQRPKYSAEASSPECSVAVNDGSFAQDRGIDLNTTDHNLVILAAARNDEVAWDTENGGALTYNLSQCLDDAADSDHSGSVSMQELTACVQGRLDKSQLESARQHATLAGNGALVPAFGDAKPATLPAAAAAVAPQAGAVDTLATLNDIYNQRDDRWEVQASVEQPQLRIGTDLKLSIRSQRPGFVYVFYRGTQPDSFYLLFPNQLDSVNAITAEAPLELPRPSWSVTALGPSGTDHLLVMVTETARDFSSLALPSQYVSAAGPFNKFQPTAPAAARVGEIATVSAAAQTAACAQSALKGERKRDLGLARRCSSVFGASLLSVQEIE